MGYNLYKSKGDNMATTLNFVNYVCEQLEGIGEITYKKMFGEYMVYLNSKPVITVCDNTAFVKELDCIKEDMKASDVGYPYDGAKVHYILDIDNAEFSKKIVLKIEEVTPLPKKRINKKLK